MYVVYLHSNCILHCFNCLIRYVILYVTLYYGSDFVAMIMVMVLVLDMLQFKIQSQATRFSLLDVANW